MRYHQLTSEERNALSTLRKQGGSQAEIARALGRHRSTIGRELKRNSRKDGGYRPFTAGEMTRGRRSRSRRNWHFNDDHWALVREQLKQLWSPDQIAGRLRDERRLFISHETIYRYVWNDWARGGTLHRYLRGSRKQKRKRYRAYDSRGRLAGKRPIADRPAGAHNRSRIGHLEGDTMMGGPDQHCIMTLVDRKPATSSSASCENARSRRPTAVRFASSGTPTTAPTPSPSTTAPNSTATRKSKRAPAR
jgi:IS30 family transposase